MVAVACRLMVHGEYTVELVDLGIAGVPVEVACKVCGH